ncbi:MAG: S-methyl-5-thioribose-1-phosphate isomerase [Armatimonadota bacterium]|nr:S-methyl-5-thioribose-1-phosphate isomerase [Armatimonadota bacterium]MDR7386182.1 S-methyl-5-thioribose-1-phosphate isomerase [Armatimonadota bacterium]MDR7389254.1 S-methyl-5-thioribose-1-phosphate isomerase [Armatimonadota bacterium]MDR7393364.1 S-methyl-5-thioribose-1-phosphate isomerase [Armatimonadota bacterium]MDR7396452.1 S-methyl-5-thioribose-1-phosphate isomerase [Armatimonadota bacterium]
MTWRSLFWEDDSLCLLDQTQLPHRACTLRLRDWTEVVHAIRDLRVRGAPAIGAAGAYALALAARRFLNDPATFWPRLQEAAAAIRTARPTAVNLSWAVDRVLRAAEAASDAHGAAARILAEAHRIAEEDERTCRALAEAGARELRDGERVLTLCNTGSLATLGVGTALGILRVAWESGKRLHVYACETRPLLQGSRLTAWELQQLGIPFHVVVDSGAGWLMARGLVDRVVVGADRVAANGDVANKVGTYTLAVLARRHDVPFWVAAPLSTVDLATPSGEAIPVEERAAHEVTHLAGVPVAPEGAPALNFAFDVTPAELVDALVTEAGLVRPPFGPALRSLKEGARV